MLIRIREFSNGPRGRWLQEQLAGVFVALLIVAALTAALAAALLWLPVEHVSIVYLIPVIVAALRWGGIPAMFAAIAGIAASAFFFYAPYYDFRVHSPAQIVDIVLFIVVATITGRMAVAVREAKIRAQAESLRDALIGSVSHELRTPLASIMGSASILAQAPAIDRDAHLSSLVRVVRDEAERLNGDIQNLLDATRISSDGIRPHWGWVDPEDVVNGALVRKRRLLGDRQIALAIADDLPLVYVDPSMIESALAQLIENAAKYSAPRTSITIGAAQENGTIQIKVANEGEALASGEIEKIFERFYRSPRYAGAIPGSGLGLWIARALIEACGGRVQAVSSGHGTTFRIDLPVRAQPSSDEYADE
ncbi:MAG TPA: ATP-binding protein [Bradyrhizobium sp.]|jgi:K+-sensing histidine kinase KdpD|nr:ATP-binding protein [Bradyrhizobium sp.]